jgi:maltooligosyltrehalose trehalohydrolase
LRAFIDAAHAVGLGVILDVVYNHFGPDGNYLSAFSDHYLTDRYENEWGQAINFDGEEAGPVREFFRENAAYWIDEFHFDGLRLDATQSINDASETHILSEISQSVRKAARGRGTYIVAENEPQQTDLVRPIAAGGNGIDALWNDDFHHTATVALTGYDEAYYCDYRGAPQELISALRWGYLFQGQRYFWQKKCRGTPALDLVAHNFVTYLENHDQVANSSDGARLHRLTSAGCLRALTALWLLAPPTPMFFQGQEFASSAPFLYFADHNPDLMKLVQAGRSDFLKQFPSLATDETQQMLADPGARSTFERCKLDFSEREKNRSVYELHKDLLRLRREDPVFSKQRADAMHGAVLGAKSLALRFLHPTGERLLLVNLGPKQDLCPGPEPLLAPPSKAGWQLLWSSEHPKYGGRGTPVAKPDENWSMPPHSALVLAPAPLPPHAEPVAAVAKKVSP